MDFTLAAFLWGDPDPDHPKGTQPLFHQRIACRLFCYFELYLIDVFFF